MTTQTEALKLALKKAFQLGQNYWALADSEYSSHWKKADKAKADFEQLVEDTLEEALAQPEQEPEIWLDLEKLTAGGMAYATNFQSTTKQSKLYTTPPQRNPLTDEQIKDVATACMWWVREQDILDDAIEFARAIEAKLKEKNS